MTKTIPATLLMLTRDSDATIGRALESAKGFEEIIIADASSQDGTRSIAAQFGARVIEQDTAFLDGDRRITNFSGVRNQLLAAATHPWRFFLDSDECLTDALLEEIQHVIETQQPAAYWVPRKYVYRDLVIEHASTYPIQQMRFFHADAVTEYHKPIHERIVPRSGSTISTLNHAMLVPLPDSVSELIARWRRYLLAESIRLGHIPFRKSLRLSARELAIAIRYLLKTVIVILTIRHPYRLPLRFELARIWYQFKIAELTLKASLHFTSHA